jgi:hypothetical protein
MNKIEDDNTPKNTSPKKGTISKTVQVKEDFFIEFTQEEMAHLNIAPHDKFEIEIQSDDKGQFIVLKKFEKLDIDLKDLDRATLEMLIAQSIESQVPVDEIIRQSLTDYLKKIDQKG